MKEKYGKSQSCKNKGENIFQRKYDTDAAQFSPFSALSGFEEMIREESRQTQKKHELSDDEINALNYKLMFLSDHMRNEYPITVTYFVPDIKKSGGKYVTLTGTAKDIRRFEGILIMSDGTVIPFCDIYSLCVAGCDYCD